jgi:hypothetical protein
MKKKIKKKILHWILTGGLLLGTNIANAEDKTKTNAYLTRVQKDQEEGINRAEIMINNLPLLNSDIYAFSEDYGYGHFNKYRLQSFIPKLNKPQIGLAVQHKSSSFFEPFNQTGLVTRLQGFPTEQMFGELNLRYFPIENTFELYGLIDTSNIFANLVGGHDANTGHAFLIPGIDYKPCTNFSAGIETSLSSQSKLKKDYLGLRFNLNF